MGLGTKRVGVFTENSFIPSVACLVNDLPLQKCLFTYFFNMKLGKEINPVPV